MSPLPHEFAEWPQLGSLLSWGHLPRLIQEETNCGREDSLYLAEALTPSVSIAFGDGPAPPTRTPTACFLSSNEPPQDPVCWLGGDFDGST